MNEINSTAACEETSLLPSVKSPVRRVRWDGIYIIDWCLALFLCIPSLPIALIAALWVFVSDRRNPFFLQKRVGLDGCHFTIFKIRTMFGSQTDARFCEMDDDRILPGGNLIRKTRIDELPQLLNVLLGDMAVVGPRPEQIPFVEQFRTSIPDYEKRLQVKPGLTGLAQVHQGYVACEEGTRIKLSYDLEYIQTRGFRIWSHIVLNTVRIIITGHGAR